MHFRRPRIAVIIRGVKELPRSGFSGSFVRKNARFVVWTTLAALALRVLLVARFPAVVDDSRLYADIAKNWLTHGIFGITNSGVIMPTLSRLPGYPAFLAVIFAIFGKDNFHAVLLVQVLFDLGTCFLIADMARRLFSEPAAKAAFLLAALCPFLANYAAAALTETLEILFTALAFDLALRGLAIGEVKADSTRASNRIWIGCGLAVGGAILLRPDGGILLAAIGGYLLWLLARSLQARLPMSSQLSPRSIITAGVLIGVCVIATLVPWTVRNLHTLHRFQPLAPRYANDSDEAPMAGFNRWTKTWIADYVSVQEIYWNIPGEDIDVTRLPRRAFDSEQQQSETTQLFADYNVDHDITSAVDQRFAALAAARIHAAPLRYYMWLPALRIADMWLRPRTRAFPLRSALVGIQRRWALACGQPRIRPDKSALRCDGDGRMDSQPQIFWHRTIRFISSVAIFLPRQPGKSRAPLHAGMLSRGYHSCVGSLPSGCINIQLLEGRCVKACT